MKFKSNQIVLIVYFISIVGFANVCLAQQAKVIYKVEKKHEFSDEHAQDLFKLIIQGDNIFDAIVTFQIINSNGNQLYKEKFTVGEVMEFGPIETDKAYERSKEDSAIIIEVFNQFFDERSFTKPAIQEPSGMEDNYSPYEDWKTIRQEPNATGFHYQLGAEDGRSIAYSRVKKKVILYFTCC